MSGEPEQAPTTRRRTSKERRKKRQRVSVIGVLGELLITAGVLVMLFLAWQLWWNDAIMASQQKSSAASQSQEWIAQAGAPTTPQPSADPEAPPVDHGEPPVAAAPAHGEILGVLYVPRFGPEYARNIAQGTSLDVLNSMYLGVGRYDNTQMPGEPGNFAIAAHRSAWGGGMHLVNELQLGDAIYVQTADGYYTYRFRNLEYVQPTAGEVLAPVPGLPEAAANERFITLTTCNPLLSTAERIIAYGVFESWQPLSAGPPAEIAAQVAAQAQKG